MSLSRSDKEAARELLRFATHAVLSSTTGAAVPQPAVHDVVNATSCMKHFACGGCRPHEAKRLWGRRRPRLLMVKLLNVAFRRAETASTAEECRAYLNLLSGILESFSWAVVLPAKNSPHLWAEYGQAARSIVLSGVLHCCSRLVTNVRSYGLRAEADDYFRNVSEVLLPLASTAFRLVSHSTFPENFPSELFAALRSSAVLDHAAKFIHDAAAGGIPDLARPCDLLLDASYTICGYPAYWAQLREAGLPGPFLLHLITTAAVVALHEYDGGTMYGLPPEGAASARLLLAAVHASHEPMPYKLSGLTPLCTWVRLLTPCCGLPQRCPFSARDMYRLCMRVTTVCMSALRALEALVDSSGVAAAALSLEPQRENVAAVVICLHRRYQMEAAVGAVLSAHDALWQMKHDADAGGGAPAWSAAAAWAADGGGEAREPPEPLVPPLDLVRPLEWWQAAVVALKCALEHPEELRGRDNCFTHMVTVLADFVLGGHLAVELPDVLPPAPPPDVANALSAGLLSCLERAIPASNADVSGLQPSDHHLQLLIDACSWPHMAWMMAYGEQRQVEALVVKLGKGLQPSGPAVIAVQRSLQVLRHGLHCFSNVGDVATESSSSSAVGGAAHDPVQGAPYCRLRCMLTLAIEQWLPAWLRCMQTLLIARFPDKYGKDATVRLGLTILVAEALAVLHMLMNEVQQGHQQQTQTKPGNRREAATAAAAAKVSAPPPTGCPTTAQVAAAAKWRRFLVEDAGLPAVLVAVAMGIVHDRLDALMLGPLLRIVLRQALLLYREDMRAALRRRGFGQGHGELSPMKAFVTLLGPDGPLPHKPLLQLVRAVHDGEPRSRVEQLAEAVVDEAPVLLARMAKYRTKTRTYCDSPCCTMVCRSEAILQLPPRGLHNRTRPITL